MQRGETGDGYIYYRDRSRGFDVTVYEHQLMLLPGEDSARVFDDETDVHHHAPHRAANVPNGVLDMEYLDVVDREDHRSNGGDRWVADHG